MLPRRAGLPGSSRTSETSAAGRLARQDGGDASGDFQRGRQAAQDGGYFGGDVGGFGDEAFCTSACARPCRSASSSAPAGDLAYVSLIDPAAMENGDLDVRRDGQMISPKTCAMAGEIALAMLR